MSRFFVKPEAVDNEAKKITILGDDVKHIRNVLRLEVGDRIIVSDGCGTDYHVAVEGFEKDAVIVIIEASQRNQNEPPIDITLYQGIPKSDKMDYIIQKSVELGIKRIVPILTERTIVKFDGKRDMEGKRARWQRIALEAAKQCNRGIIPVVDLPMILEKALEETGKYAASIIPYENEYINRMKDCCGLGAKEGMAVFIGPEGGFADSEVADSVKKGVLPVTLGPRILRTETAGIAVLSILMYEFGDMG